MLNLLNDAVKAYHQIPPGAWQAILASGILSPALHIWHKIHVTRKEKEIAEWAMLAITILVAFGASVFQYLLNTHPGNPKIIALHTSVLAFTMTPTYIWAVKPIFAWLSAKNAQSNVYAAQLAELKSAVIPSTGLPNLPGTAVSATADQNQKDGF